PLIIISRDTNRARVEEIMNAGADVFLGKPIGVDELVRAVATVTQEGAPQDDDWPLLDDHRPLSGEDRPSRPS
ncbi:MAG: response regulator transcription factor, partial [Anaerolineae bacterium]|nr:response regulator transcription factor [Anaerolineae bacterium]